MPVVSNATRVDALNQQIESLRQAKLASAEKLATLLEPQAQAMDARGYDVWIRPDGEHGLVLLGGLKKKDVQTLCERDFAPATVVETAQRANQAWVKLSQNALADLLRWRAAEVLVQGLGRHGGECHQPRGWATGVIHQPAGATDW